MTWNGAPDAPPSTRIAALASSMQPSELRVAETIAADIRSAVDMTAQELADAAGVGRASVVRTAQSLGYDGYPQLRVALARERAFDEPVGEAAPGGLGIMRSAIDRFARALPHSSASLDEQNTEAFLAALDGAGRVVIAATGLSGPLGYDLALRLASAGRPAEFLPDALAQQIAARQLSEGDALFAISGSGATSATLEAVNGAREAGATVLALTAFARSPLTAHATATIVVPPASASFRDELLQTSRAGLALMVEALVEAFIARRGERGSEARAAALAAVSHTIDA